MESLAKVTALFVKNHK